jgi:hypothetical protein
MRRTLTLPLVPMIMLFVALAGGTVSHAAARALNQTSLLTTTESLPFKGTLEGLHLSRTPMDPPFVFDRFAIEGQATHLGQFELIVESTVNFGSRPVTGYGTYTFTAANGDQLVADHTGFSTLVGPGSVLITERGVVDPDRSTGRFAGASGTFTVERFADAATGVGGLTVGTVDGTLSLLLPTSG